MQATWPHAGAVLIGGRSSRMGRPKHEIVLADGRTMLDHVVDAVGGLCARVVMVGGEGSHVNRGLNFIADLRPHLGPLGGIEALLASGVDSEYLVCPCDVPLIDERVLRRLIESGTNESLATMARVEGRAEAECLPARINAAALPIVRELLDERELAVWKLMERLGAEVATIPGALAGSLANINAPDDLVGLAALAPIDRHRAGAATHPER